MYRLLISLLIVFNSSNYALTQCTNLIDLNQWIEAGSDGISGNWVVSANGMELTQTINSQPTMFISPEEFINVEITGSIEVETFSDNDYVGFVFGLQEPTGITNTGDTLTMEAYLFDWKQAYQNNVGNIAQEGYALSYINGTVITDATYHPFWTHNTGGAFTLLDSIYGSNTGWNDHQVYDFRLIYQADYVAIYIDEVLIFELDDCFEPGRFGFYNYSQEQVTYSNFLYTPINDFEVEGICVGDSTSFLFTEDSCTLALGNGFSNVVSWEWDFGNGDSSTASNPTTYFPNVGSFDVSVITEDSLGCQDTTERTVEIYDQYSLHLEDTLQICLGDSVTISPYFYCQGLTFTYQWSPSTHISNDTILNPIVFPTQNTMYTIVATDSNGMTATDSVLIMVDQTCCTVHASFDYEPIICLGDTNLLTVTSQSPDSTIISNQWVLPFGAQIDSGNFNSEVIQISFYQTGNFSIGLNSTSTCGQGYVTDTIQVLSLPPIQGMSNYFICASDTLEVVGNSSSPNLTYNWTPIAVVDTPNIPNPTFIIDSTLTIAGSVTNDTTGCTASESVTVTLVTDEQLNLPDTSVCLGEAVSYTVDSNYFGHTIFWNNGQVGNSNSFNQTGTYWVEVHVQNACVHNDTFNVTVFDEMSDVTDQIICQQDSIHITGNSNNTDWSYSWTPSHLTTSPSIANPSFVVDTSVTIIGILTDNVSGCTSTDTVRVDFVNGDNLDLPDTVICLNDVVVYTVPDQYQSYPVNWSDGAIGVSNTFNAEGVYWVSVLAQSSCVLVDTFSIEFYEQKTFELPYDDTICSDSYIHLTPIEVNNQNQDLSYYWSTQDTTDFIQVNQEGIYSVTIQDQCYNYSFSATINEKRCLCEVNELNVISPNSDGINDSYVFTYSNDNGLLDCTVEEYKIYNRWGTLIAQGDDNEWDGTFSKGGKVTEGTYYFIFEANNEEYSGYITVVY